MPPFNHPLYILPTHVYIKRQWRNNAAALLEDARLQQIFDAEYAAGHQAMAYPWYYTQVRMRGGMCICVYIVVWAVRMCGDVCIYLCGGNGPAHFFPL